MRRRLLAAAALSAVLASPAFAQVPVEGERNDPIETATANDGAASDVVITASGRVVLDNPGPAVVLNSDNTLTTETGSSIEISDVDGATGVLLEGGNTGAFVHDGRIEVVEEYIASDSGTDLVDLNGDGVADEADNEADGPFSEGSGRTGLLIAGDAPFNGDVTLNGGSTIRVFGQDSYGVRAQTGLNGDFTSDGEVVVRGERSIAISLEDTVNGDVEIDGRVAITGPDGQGVVVSGDVEGAARFAGTVSANGFRVNTRSSASFFSILDDGDDNLPAGAAILIEGSVRDGVFFVGPGANEAGAVIDGNGAAPTVVVRPGEEAAGDISIGEVVVPAGFDPDRSEEEDTPLGRGFVNEGRISANSIFDGAPSRALLIAGRDVNGDMRAVIIEGGFLNTGTIQAASFDADVTTATFGAGLVTPLIENTGVITSSANNGLSEDGFGPEDEVSALSRAVVIEAGADVQTLLNSGSIVAATQLGGEARAVQVDSESLTLIENTNAIRAAGSNIQTGPDGEDPALDTTLTAIDARDRTTGLTVRQSLAEVEEGETAPTPIIQGDIRFGSGDDSLILEAGSVEGDVFFGLGEDQLTLRDADINGVINDSDGRLTIDAERASLNLVGDETLSLTNARFGEGAVLDITIDENSPAAANFFVDASGTISFEQGSDLSISLANILGEETSFNILRADQISIADEEAILGLAESPYLFEASLERSVEDADVVVLNLRRRTPDELGLNANQTAAFAAAIETLEGLDDLGAAFAGLREAETFFAAYDQLLPNFNDSALQFALANNDAATGALATRLRNARLAPDRLAGLWVQEFGYYADRNTTALAPGYRGQGFGVALGVDRPLGPFYAVGFHVVGSASEIEEIDGFDQPLIALSIQGGAYAGLEIGGFDVSGSASIGLDDYESERRVFIGGFDQTATANWSGWQVSAGGTVGRDIRLGKWVVRPEAALTYIRLSESDFVEDDGGTGFGLSVDSRESSLFTGSGNLSVARRFEQGPSWWMPYFRAGYRGDLTDTDLETVARFTGSDEIFRLRADELPGTGFLLGFGLSAGSNYSTFTFAYDADIRDDFIRHVGRVVIRITF